MCSVLVIDDDAAVRQIIDHALTQQGYSVVTAPNGRDGLARFSSGRFDVVVTDVRMPDLSGTDVLAGIRRSGRNRTPVIGISGTPRLLENAGFDFRFVKPFSLRELVALIKVFCPASDQALQFSM